MSTHIRSIALALVGTLGSCLNTRPSGIGTLQMLMHEKMYDLITRDKKAIQF